MKHRRERVCEVLKRELGMLILKDLHFDSKLVTINSVDITPDFKKAHVYISAMGDEKQRKNALEILKAHRPQLQQVLSKRVTLKNTPQLYFKLDESVERGNRTLDLMDELGL